MENSKNTINIPPQIQNWCFIKIMEGQKIPIEKDWQNTNNYSYEEFKDYIKIGSNYAVVGLKEKIIIDIDKKSPEFEDGLKAAESLPETFTVETANGGRHYYFYCHDIEKGIRLRNEVGEVRAKGMYVVGPSSELIGGKRYTTIKYFPVATITKADIERVFAKWIGGETKEVVGATKKPSDKTRSGQEWGIICKMIEKGLPKEEILKKMQMYAKWSEAPPQYRNHQYTKALKHIEQKKAEEIKKIEEKYDLKSLSFDIITKIAAKKRSEATEALVKKILEQEHIYTTRDDEKSEMWIYRNGIYVPQAKTYIKETCRKILGEVYNVSLGNEVISKIEAGSYVEQDKFFENKNIEEIAIENGILNIITKELTGFTPEKTFFNKLPIEYNPNAECENIKKHFKAVLKYEEDIPVIEEIFGYLLLREYKIEKAFMFVGTGRNGKSKTLELMKRFIGIDNCASIPLQHFENDQFAIGELFNKMANIAGDLDKKALKNTGDFKTLTGRDLISASRKFLTRVKFINYAKLIFACNELPTTYDLSHAFFARWVVLEFPYTFVTQEEFDKIEDVEEKSKNKIQDTNIIEKIATAEELSGLLNLALNGLERILDNKDFSYSKNTDEVKRFWMRKSSSFQGFLMDCIEEDWESQTLKIELRHAYSDYCRKHKLTSVSDKAIKIILETTLGATDERRSIEREQVPVWVGIRLKNEVI
ncbi:MAG TPA: phage/plasmid primase, P4 family [Clostridia bacterium]|nr:phage/plasmid primase, P4 family [Clostridia bacterium]